MQDLNESGRQGRVADNLDVECPNRYHFDGSNQLQLLRTGHELQNLQLRVSAPPDIISCTSLALASLAWVCFQFVRSSFTNSRAKVKEKSFKSPKL